MTKKRNKERKAKSGNQSTRGVRQIEVKEPGEETKEAALIEARIMTYSGSNMKRAERRRKAERDIPQQSPPPLEVLKMSKADLLLVILFFSEK